MHVRDIMTTDVVTVTPDTSVPDVARLLLQHRISAVPVVSPDRQVLGMVSERDLMRRPEMGTTRQRSWWLALVTSRDDLAREYALTHGKQAADVMSREVVSVTEETPLGTLARLLEEHHIKRVPVVREGKLVGIVSRADLLRELAMLQDEPDLPSPPDDRTIREKLLEVLHGEPWVTPRLISVLVHDGVVHLWGAVHSEAERNAVRVAARNITGVRGIEDHLTI